MAAAFYAVAYALAFALPIAVAALTGNPPVEAADPLSVLWFAAAGWVARAVIIVAQGSEQLVERLGRFNRRLGAGVHLVVPLIESVSYKCSLRERVLDVCITTDNAPLSADAVVYYRVFDSRLARYAVEDHVQALENLVLTQLRGAVGKLTLDETFTARAALGAALLAELDEVVGQWGLVVTRVEVRDILPDQSIKLALEKQMTAERVKRADILESEGKRDAAVNVAGGNAQAAVVQAKAEAEATVLAAKAEAEAEVLAAEGRKEAAVLEASGLALGIQQLADELGVSSAEASQIYLDRLRVAAASSIGAAPSSKVLFVDPAGVGSAATGAGVGGGVGALAGAAAAVVEGAARDDGSG
eukprot:PRCOL_00004513-RA